MEVETAASVSNGDLGHDTSHENLWKIARKNFLKRVEEEDGVGKIANVDVLNDINSPKDAIKACKKIKDKADGEYSTGVHGQATSTKQLLKEKLNKVLKKMQLFAAYGDTTMSFCPESVGLVWAGLRFILQIAFDDMELCSFLVDSCDEISSAMFIGEVYYKRYAQMCQLNLQQPADIGPEPTGDLSVGKKVVDYIPRMYSEILYFSYQAKTSIALGQKNPLTQNKLGRALKNLGSQPLPKLKGSLEIIVKMKRELNEIAGMEYQSSSMTLLEGLYGEAKKSAEKLEIGFDDLRSTSAFVKEIMSGLNQEIGDIKDLLKKNSEKEDEKNLLAQVDRNISWMDPVEDAFTEMTKSFRLRRKGTCKWIFKTQAYENWFSDPEPNLLWLCGDMGSGKTTILSTVTKKLLKKLSKQALEMDPKKKQKKSKEAPTQKDVGIDAEAKNKEPPRLLVFYCKTGDDKTQTTESLLWNLIAQIYVYCQKRMKSTPELLAGCNEIINAIQQKEKDKGSGQMKTARGKHKPLELQKILTNFANISKGEFFIIIDALDECVDRVSEGLIDVIKNLSSQFRILVSSRPESDIEAALKSTSQIRVGVDQNSKDIKAFVNAALKDMLGLTDDERKGAPREIAKRADGMFRYAAMAVESLKQPWQRPLSSHLKAFPGVDALYQRNIEQLSPQQRTLLITAIRWTLLSDRPVPVEQVAEDYNNIFKSMDEPEKKGSATKATKNTSNPNGNKEENSNTKSADSDEDEDDSEDSDLDDVSSDEEDIHQGDTLEGSIRRKSVQIDTLEGNIRRKSVIIQIDTYEISKTLPPDQDQSASVPPADSKDDSKQAIVDPQAEASQTANNSHKEANGDLNQEDEEAKHKAILANDISHIREANGVFLRVLENNTLEFRHASAKEYILESAKKGLKLRSVVKCDFCIERLQQVSTIDCAPKMGHLKLAITCLQHLNNAKFQERFLLKLFPDPDAYDEADTVNDAEDDGNGADDQSEDGATEDKSVQGETDAETAADQSKETNDEENTQLDVEPSKDANGIKNGANKENGVYETHEPMELLTTSENSKTIDENRVGSPSIADSLEATYNEARQVAESSKEGAISEDEMQPDEVQPSTEALQSEVDEAERAKILDDALSAVSLGQLAGISEPLDRTDAQSVDSDYEFNNDGDNEEVDVEPSQVLRYEVEKWYLHLREADKLWDQDEQKKDESWRLLWSLVDKFMLENEKAFHAWQRAVIYDMWDIDYPLDPLQVASAINVPTLVTRMLEKGIKATNGEAEHRYTALFFASRNGNVDIMKELIDHGADPNAQQMDEGSDEPTVPLHWAGRPFAGADHSEAIELLLKRGAKAYYPEWNLNRPSFCHLCANENMVGGLEALLQRKADVNAQDGHGETVLQWALSNPNVKDETVEVLLRHKANVNKEDNDSQRPLAQACEYDIPHIVKRIIEAGADIDDPDDSGITALHTACKRGYDKVAEVLVDAGANIMLKDNNGKTALATAVDNGEIKCVIYMLRKHAEKDPEHNFLYLKDNRGRTILHKASAKGYHDVLKEILNYGDAKKLLAVKDLKIEATPLHPAAFRNHLESVKVLVEAGADPTAKNAKGETPVELALRGWYLDYGNDQEAITYLITASRDDVESRQKVVWSTSANNSRLLEAALALGPMELDFKDAHGWTPMLRAVHCEEQPCIDLLHAHGVEIIDLEVESKIFPNEKLGYWPTKFDTVRKAEIFDLSEDGFIVNLKDNPTNQGYAIQANHPFPAGNQICYYEIEILPGGYIWPEVSIGLGSLMERLETTSVGWECIHSFPWGYNSVNGRIYSSIQYLSDDEINNSIEYGPSWDLGDVVGCLMDFKRGNIMFTKNGEFLGVAFRNIDYKGRCAMVALRTCNSVRINFGNDPEWPFKFDWKSVDLEKIAQGDEEKEDKSENDEEEENEAEKNEEKKEEDETAEKDSTEV